VRLLDFDGEFFVLDALGAGALAGLLAGGADAAIAHLQEAGFERAAARAEAEALCRELTRRSLLVDATDRPEGLVPYRARRYTIADKWLAASIRGVIDWAGTPRRLAAGLFPLVKLSLMSRGWERTVELFGSVAATRPAGLEVQREPLERIARQLFARSLLRAECKERSLLYWTLARCFGVDVDLVVGIRLYPFGGHCWCESNSQVLTDDIYCCAAYQPVLRYRFACDHFLRENLC